MDNVFDFPGACRHRRYQWRDVELSVCETSGAATWTEGGDPLDGSVAMAILFGNFDLTGCLDGVGAPGAAVMVYEPSRGGRTRMNRFPANHWIEAVDGLWFTHDGERLLLSPSDPQLAANLTH